MFVDASDSPVDLFIEAISFLSMHHWQQFCSQSELSLFNSEEVVNDDTADCHRIPAFHSITVNFAEGFVLLIDLPIRSKIIDVITSNRHYSSSAKEDVVRVYSMLDDDDT